MYVTDYGKERAYAGSFEQIPRFSFVAEKVVPKNPSGKIAASGHSYFRINLTSYTYPFNNMYNPIFWGWRLKLTTKVAVFV